MRTPSGRRSRLAACASLFAALLAIGASTAALAGDDDDDTFEQKVIKKVLGGLGVDVGQGPNIEYRERSPLVIPPTRDLPPPETTGTVNNPAWPKDPQVQSKKRAKAKSLDSIGEYNMRKATLSPEELRRGQGVAPGKGPVTEPNHDPSDNTSEYGSRPLTPTQLGAPSFFSLFGGKKNEQAPFVKEPDRTSLTQPPPGYQTPSPNYPYGVGGEAKNTSTLDMPQIKDPQAAGSVH